MNKTMQGLAIIVAGLLVMGGCAFMYLQDKSISGGLGLIAFFIGGGLLYAGANKLG